MEDYFITKMYKVTYPTGYYHYYTADELTLVGESGFLKEAHVETITYEEYLDRIFLQGEKI